MLRLLALLLLVSATVTVAGCDDGQAPPAFADLGVATDGATGDLR